MRAHVFSFLVFLFVGCSQAMAATSALEYNSAWQCNDRKFLWYCDYEQEEKKIEKKLNKEVEEIKEKTAKERLAEFSKMLEEAKAKAILEPTEENLANYIRLQNKAGEMAAKFADQWKRVIWKNPDLDYSIKRPINNAAIDQYNIMRAKAQEETLKKISQKYGIFFFFRSDCPYCHIQARGLKLLEQVYGVEVYPITLDGGGLPEYPNPKLDNGIAAKLGVKIVPAVLLYNSTNNEVIPIANGVASTTDIVERIFILTQTKPGDLF